MSTVINFINIIIIIAGCFFYLLGLGIFPFSITRLLKVIDTRMTKNLLKTLAILLMVGILINYGLVLIVKSISTSTLIGSIISITGLSVSAFLTLKHHRVKFPQKITIFRILGVILVLFLFFSPILTEPLSDWDARSIWFFHAKMIYSAKNIGLSAGWADPSVSFSHPDYPKLVPLMAAQITDVAGFWNEFLPKASIFMMFLPMILLIFSFGKKSLSFFFLFALIPFSFYNSLWNGYMDGLLALYLSISILLISKFFKSSEFIDLFTGLLCLSISVNIKNEGVLGTLAVIISILIFHMISKNGDLLKQKKIRISKWIFIWLPTLIPCVLWTIYGNRWGLSNDLQIGSNQSFLNIGKRIFDGSLSTILVRSYQEINGAGLILIICMTAILLWRKDVNKIIYLPLTSSLLIFLGLVTVYLSTPHDMIWHLNTSVDRTMLPVSGGILIASYFLLESIET